MKNYSFDVLVIGGGIAGTSVAANLAPKMKVCVIEAEEHAGYHSTGRSVAVYAPSYGSDIIRNLTDKSSDLFLAAEKSIKQSILNDRGFLFIASKEQETALSNLNKELSKNVCINTLSGKEIFELVPALRKSYVHSAIYDPRAKDIDVASLHSYYIRKLREAGAQFLLSHKAKHISKHSEGYDVGCDGSNITCKTIVNAAGAWADQIADLAGCKKIGLRPLRRTAFSFNPPDWDYAKWPVVIDCEEKFYIKPEVNSVIGSPADETIDIPRDVYPEEIDIAVGMDRINMALDFSVKNINSSWAGLRTFTPDRDPAVGYDPQQRDFFWLAGQGGYGIQTAPYLGKLAASMIESKNYNEENEESNLITALDPKRFC